MLDAARRFAAHISSRQMAFPLKRALPRLDATPACLYLLPDEPCLARHLTNSPTMRPITSFSVASHIYDLAMRLP